MGTTQSNNLANTPDTVPIADKDTGRVNFNWNQWFTNVQIKLNTITASIVALSKNATAGFFVSDGAGGVYARTLTPGTGISITNGTGVGGNPVISVSGGAGGSPMHVTNNTATSYTAQLTDAPASTANVGWITSDSTSANVINIDLNANVAFPIGTDIYISQKGAGTTTINANVGVSFHGIAITGAGKYAVGRVVQIATDVWSVFGNLAYTVGVLYSATILSDSPIGYWRLGETSGTVAADSSGNGHNGTYVNCTLGAASLTTHNAGNLAASFNGTSSYISVVSGTLANLNLGCSWEFWVNPTNINNSYQLCSGGPRSVAIRQINAGIELDSDGYYAYGTLAAPITANTTYHLVVTISPGLVCTMYINGSSIGTISMGTNYFITSNTTLYLGEESNSSLYFSGILDEIAIYNTVLTSTQVAAHYAAGT